MKYNRIVSILEANKDRWRDHPYIFEKREGQYRGHTYGDFYQDVQQMASYLQAQNLRGKKLALYGANSYDYMVADVAVLGYAGTCLALSDQWQAEDIGNIIKTLGLDGIVYDPAKAETISALRAAYPDLAYISFQDRLDHRGQGAIPLEVGEKDCGKIIFSSGTTGFPKAVMLSQKNMFANLPYLLRRAPMNEKDTCYLFLPLSHTYGGLCNFLYSLHTGMQIYLASDKTKIMEEVQEVKPSVFCGVPLVLEKIYHYSQAQGLSLASLLGGRIAYLFCGGAFLKPEIRQAFKAENINLLEAYGLSETSSLISIEYPNRDDFESVGTIFENVELKIDRPNQDGVGEILVKGENIFIGYYQRPDLYQAAFSPDGFFRTGDLGYIKGDKLYLVGRKKRTIIRANARNIEPEEIEQVVLSHIPAQAVKVYEREGLIHCSVYANNLGPDLTGQAIMDRVNPHLAKHARIDRCQVLAYNLDTRLK